MLDPNQIRQAREALSLSQRELARRAGISRTGLNQLEQGKIMPGPHFSRKLRDFFERAGVEITARVVTLTPPRPELTNPAQGRISKEDPEHISTPTGDESDDADLVGYVLVILSLGLSIALGRSVGG